MDIAIVTAIGTVLVALITAFWNLAKGRQESRDRKVDRVTTSQNELIAIHREDAETERTRRIAVQAEADGYRRETDRLRDLLTQLITWVSNGATPPPPEIGMKDLWRDDD